MEPRRINQPRQIEPSQIDASCFPLQERIIFHHGHAGRLAPQQMIERQAAAFVERYHDPVRSEIGRQFIDAPLARDNNGFERYLGACHRRAQHRLRDEDEVRDTAMGFAVEKFVEMRRARARSQHQQAALEPMLARHRDVQRARPDRDDQRNTRFYQSHGRATADAAIDERVWEPDREHVVERQRQKQGGQRQRDRNGAERAREPCQHVQPVAPAGVEERQSQSDRCQGDQSHLSGRRDVQPRMNGDQQRDLGDQQRREIDRKKCVSGIWDEAFRPACTQSGVSAAIAWTRKELAWQSRLTRERRGAFTPLSLRIRFRSREKLACQEGPTAAIISQNRCNAPCPRS